MIIEKVRPGNIKDYTLDIICPICQAIYRYSEMTYDEYNRLKWSNVRPCSECQKRKKKV